MTPLIEKLKKVEQELSNEKGAFVLFALFLREDAIGQWDMLVSAGWIDGDKKLSLDYIAGKLQESLTPEELISLSRIVLVDNNNPALDAILHTVRVEHGLAEIRDSNFFGLDIKHAFIITANRNKEEVKVS